MAAYVAMLEIPHQGRGVQVGNGGNAQTSHSSSFIRSFHNINKPNVTSDLDAVWCDEYSPLSTMSSLAVSSSATHLLEWLAISLTPGMGATKGRKLIENFGGPEAVFRASLTELEGAGIRAVSAQSIATGKSAELAREEIAKAAAEGVTVLSMEDPFYPPGSRKSTIRRWSFIFAAIPTF